MIDAGYWSGIVYRQFVLYTGKSNPIRALVSPFIHYMEGLETIRNTYFWGRTVFWFLNRC